MSWLTGAINAFAFGAGGAIVNSATQKTETQSDTPKEVKQAAIKADKSAQSIKPRWGGFAPTLEIEVPIPDPRNGPHPGSGTQIG